jgi:uncharacterized protein YbjT (DUF2867 family)
MGRKAVVLGASGLVGSALLQQLLTDAYFEEVLSIGRRPLAIAHAKLTHVTVDFEKPKEWEHYFAESEVVFCAVGTTQKAVGGDDRLYRKVDYDIPVHAAEAAARYGVFSFILVSAIGADVNSQNFYLKLKGVTEESVAKQAIPQVAFLRPSLLMGDRKEQRMGEKLAQWFAPLFSPLLFGSARKYKPIQADQVASAMIHIAKNQVRGMKVYEYADMVKAKTA